MQFDIWTQSLLTAMNTLWGKLAGFIPNLLGALVVVLLGFVIAKLLDALLSKLLAKLGLDRLMGGTGLTKLLARVGIQVPVSTLVGKIVYWFVLLVFLVSAAESLGLQRVSATLDVLALYLPKVFGAALVLIVGVLLAQLVNSVVRGAADGVGLEYANGLGRIAQWLVIIISISVAVGQARGQDRPAQLHHRHRPDHRRPGRCAGPGPGQPRGRRADHCRNLRPRAVSGRTTGESG